MVDIAEETEELLHQISYCDLRNQQGMDKARTLIRRALKKQTRTFEKLIVTSEGQLKVGDEITIVGKSKKDDQKTTVREVIEVDGHEQIIINKTRNDYFTTRLLIIGCSWVEQVQITNRKQEVVV